MRIYQFKQEQTLPLTLDEAWSFFSSPRNLDEITPPELGFRIESLDSETMHEGQIITYKVKIGPGIWWPWVTEIKAVDERASFIDEQRFGPYRFWHHRHTFESVPEGVRVVDVVHYGLSMGVLGRIAHVVFVKKKLQRIFAYRREILEKRFGGGGAQA